MKYSTNAGIYKITNIKNDKVYIGQSVDLKTRIHNHKYSLRKGFHHNSLLQRAFNKYGAKNFIIEVLEECDIEELDDKERFWIEFFDSTNRKYGYNFESGGNVNKVIHKETREKIRLKLKGTRLGKENPMYGKKLSKERIEQMREVNKGSSELLDVEDVKEIKIALHLGILQSELPEIFNVTISTINKIAKGYNWYWVLPEFTNSQENEVKKFKENRKKRVLDFFEKGFSATEIANQTPYTINEVQSILNGKATAATKEKQSSILDDYKNGMDRKEIAKKYNMTSSGINRILCDVTSKEFEERNLKIKELHEQGFKNIEIALSLGIHRTTVTEVLKGRTKQTKRGKTKYTKELEQQIISLLHKGLSQRKVSETLDIPRAAVKKAITNKKSKSTK